MDSLDDQLRIEASIRNALPPDVRDAISPLRFVSVQAMLANIGVRVAGVALPPAWKVSMSPDVDVVGGTPPIFMLEVGQPTANSKHQAGSNSSKAEEGVEEAKGVCAVPGGEPGPTTDRHVHVRARQTQIKREVTPSGIDMIRVVPEPTPTDATSTVRFALAFAMAREPVMCAAFAAFKRAEELGMVSFHPSLPGTFTIHNVALVNYECLVSVDDVPRAHIVAQGGKAAPPTESLVVMPWTINGEGVATAQGRAQAEQSKADIDMTNVLVNTTVLVVRFDAVPTDPLSRAASGYGLGPGSGSRPATESAGPVPCYIAFDRDAPFFMVRQRERGLKTPPFHPDASSVARGLESHAMLRMVPHGIFHDIKSVNTIKASTATRSSTFTSLESAAMETFHRTRLKGFISSIAWMWNTFGSKSGKAVASNTMAVPMHVKEAVEYRASIAKALL